jgi:hypothetical protein
LRREESGIRELRALIGQADKIGWDWRQRSIRLKRDGLLKRVCPGAAQSERGGSERSKKSTAIHGAPEQRSKKRRGNSAFFRTSCVSLRYREWESYFDKKAIVINVF